MCFMSNVRMNKQCIKILNSLKVIYFQLMRKSLNVRNNDSACIRRETRCTLRCRHFSKNIPFMHSDKSLILQHLQPQ